MSSNLKKFAVVGHPISHSLSPKIHQLFAEQNQINIEYKKIDIEPGNFLKIIKKLKDDDYYGVNVTLPFKFDAYSFCDELSDRAKYTKSVNTINFKTDSVYGNTTDGIGLIIDLNNKGIDLKNKSILLIGAGGAANGVIFDLILQAPLAILLTNRTISKSKKMENYWKDLSNKNGVKLLVKDSSSLDGMNFDLIINATSAGLNSNLSPINNSIYKNNKNFSVCYDMSYRKETPFIREARQRDVMVYDGLGMLIEQAAASFFIWHKIKPTTNNIASKL
jgi:shikimate dehydrogenase